jgi:hypothetical protein
MKIIKLPAIKTALDGYLFNIKRYFEISNKFIDAHKKGLKIMPLYKLANHIFNDIIQFELDNINRIIPESPTQLGIEIHFQYYMREIRYRKYKNVKTYGRYIEDFKKKPKRSKELKNHPMCPELKERLNRK